MWPFRRKQKNLENVPTEVQEYYQSEQRERVGVAWLLAFVTLVVTVAVVLGLFFGGRTIYRKLAHKDKSPTLVQTSKTTETSTSEKKEEGSSNPTTSSGDNKSKSSTTKPSPSSQPADSNASKSGNTSSATPAPAPSTDKTAAPSLTSDRITNTGPAGTLAAFMVASVLGFGLYEIRLHRKFN